MKKTKTLLRTSELLLEVNLGATAIGTRLNTPDGYQQLAVQKLAEVTNLPVFRQKT
jgi:aspartate ammonia-lyase